MPPETLRSTARAQISFGPWTDSPIRAHTVSSALAPGSYSVRAAFLLFVVCIIAINRHKHSFSSTAVVPPAAAVGAVGGPWPVGVRRMTLFVAMSLLLGVASASLEEPESLRPPYYKKWRGNPKVSVARLAYVQHRNRVIVAYPYECKYSSSKVSPCPEI